MPDLPLHPMTVHFPIALFITALGLQALGLIFKKNVLPQTAAVLYVVAVVSALVAVASGWNEANHLHLKHPLLDHHRLFAFLTLGVSCSGLVLLGWVHRYRRAFFNTCLMILLVVVSVCAATAAFYGGKMVYEYGVGVKE